MRHDITITFEISADRVFPDLAPRESRKDRTQRLAAKKQETVHTETRQQRRAAERAARKGRTE